MGTWADSFLPAITGELAQLGPGMVQGQFQGQNAARQLALLDAQIKQQHIQNQQMQRPQLQTFQPGSTFGYFDPTKGQLTGMQTLPNPVKEAQIQQAAERLRETQCYHEGLLDLRSQVEQGRTQSAQERLQMQQDRMAQQQQANQERMGLQQQLFDFRRGLQEKKESGVYNQDTALLEHTSSGLDRLSSTANELLNHPGLPGIVGMRGKVPNIPGSAAANAEALLNTLKSQIGFGVLQEMRNNSKTGGALGQVSDRENVLLQQNLAALDKAQNLEQFQESLRKLVQYRNDAVGRLQRAFNLKHRPGDVQQPTQPNPMPAPGMAKPSAQGWSIKKKG